MHKKKEREGEGEDYINLRFKQSSNLAAEYLQRPRKSLKRMFVVYIINSS